MSPQPRWLVVAALISGRNFPERPDYHLVCEARFNNEVLSTDPMPHTAQPLFEQELAWELDRARLKQHRLHRTVLKIQLYAVHTNAPVKETVGIFMLDLRSCSFNKEYKWFRLLHCKYKGSPEVFCGIYLDTNENDVRVDQPVQTGLGSTLSTIDLTPRVLSMIDDKTESCYPSSDAASKGVWHVIGPKALSKKPFLLTLSFGKVSNNLASLIPVTKDLSTEGQSGFYFACDILGTSVTTGRFNSLVQTNLSSEEHQFFVRSTVGVLRAYFQRISPIPVKLFYGTRCLAHAVVAADHFLVSSDSSLQHPATLEGTFQLHPIELSVGSTPSSTSMHEDGTPSVSFCLKIRALTNRSSSTQSQEPPEPQPTAVDDLIKSSNPTGHPPGILRQRNWSPMRSKSEERTTDVIAPSSLLQTQNGHLRGPENVEDAGTEGDQKIASPNENLRHFCYTIELRSLKSFQPLDTEPKLYARYVYPPFESGAPVMTMPPVTLTRHEEVILPNGFCAFEFAASLSELRERLATTPLVVEIFARSEEPCQSDTLFGRSVIQLGTIFKCPIHKATDGKSTTQRYVGVAELVCTRSMSETDLSGSGMQFDRSVGQLVYSLILEDHGPHLMPTIIETEQNPAVTQDSEAADKKLKLEDVRSTAEYRTAFELELWRANEEAKFTARLKQREQLLMATLAEEWHKRDNEREAICRKKLSEYQTLEDKLRSTLTELAARECQLAAGETELARIRQETIQQAELKRKETAQQAKAEIRELETQLKMEKTQTQHWKEQADEWRAKFTNLENELNTVRHRLVQVESRKSSQSIEQNRSEQLQASQQLELAKLATELAQSREAMLEVRRQLDEAERGRDRYKQLWARALQEVARVKQEADFNARQSLARREAELEQLRMRYLNMEEKEIIAKTVGLSEKTPATSQTNERMGQGQGSVGDGTESHQKMPGSPGMRDKQPIGDAELNRLVEERESLLSTGVYEPDDPIILDLEKKIQQLLLNQQ